MSYDSDRKLRISVWNDLMFCQMLINRLTDDTENIDFKVTPVIADIKRLRRELLRVEKRVQDIGW